MDFLGQEAREEVFHVLLYQESHAAPHLLINLWPEPVHPLPQGQSRGHTRKQCIYCQSPACNLFTQGSFSFLVNILAFPARLARGGLTPCQWSEGRCHPSHCPLAYLPVHLAPGLSARP